MKSAAAVRARLGAIVAIVLWGISFVATKAVLREVSPFTLITIRFALGAAFLCGSLAVRKLPILPPLTAIPGLALMGFIGVFVHQSLQAWGLTMTTAVNTGWLIGLIPIWAAILSAIFRGERFGRWKIAGMVLGLVGALLVVTKGDAATLGLPAARGDFLILLSTANWAIYTILGHGTIRDLGAHRATAGMMTLGWLMLVPLFIATKGWLEVSSLTLTGWGALLFLGVGCSGLGYLFWYGALQTMEAGNVSSFLFFEPIVTLVAAAILLGEQVSAITIAGGVIVTAGVVLVQRERS